MNNKGKIFLIGGIIIGVLIIGVVLTVIFLNEKKKTTTPTKTTIVYWGLWEPEGVMQPLIDQYEKDHTNINIEYVQKSFTQYETTVLTRIAQQATDLTPAPDIVRVSNAWLSKYQPYLSPLPSSIMTPAEYATEFYPDAVTSFTGTDNEIYAIPLEIDGLALFYNKKLLTAAKLTTPPTDWDSFIDAAKKLTIKKSGKITQAGVALGSSKNILHSADILSLLMLQNGVSIINTQNTVVSLDSTRAISTLDFYTSFVKTLKTWSNDLPTDLELFYSGKLAMMFAPSWRAFDIMNAATNIDFGIAPVPQVANNPEVNYATYWGDAVSATSKNQLEAWKFIEWLSQPAQEKEMYSNASKLRAFGEPYSRVSLASELSSEPYLKAIIEMAPTMKSWKMGEQTYIEESLRTAINDVIVGGIDSTDALKDAQERINTKLADIVK
ncbi:sugar ABC transporter substrate-binding protein [Candidatus Dojkabacteria bacterium]|jgi:multiple sugar transport system substrate-binding protein|nr:sugar ABC transporter substrate-binding protein [Candidatus Dojkabacteria bacterium]